MSCERRTRCFDRPSGVTAPASIVSTPSTCTATAPTGARHPPPIALSKARSATTASRTPGSSSRPSTSRTSASSLRACTASAPCAGAGGIDSPSMRVAMRPPRSSRSRPAAASTSASASPASRRRSRVSTLPWRGMTSRSGRSARRKPARRGLSVPTLAPTARSSMDRSASRVTSASRASARSGYAAMTRLGSSSSGRSFALWTARSISPATSARSSAVTNMPSPIGASGARTSPSETIVLTSTGAPLARRRAATISLCTSARRDPRVPSRSGLAEPTVYSRVWQHRQGWRRGDHVADDQRRRRADSCLVRDASDAIQGADDALLVRQGRIADHGSRP